MFAQKIESESSSMQPRPQLHINLRSCLLPRIVTNICLQSNICKLVARLTLTGQTFRLADIQHYGAVVT